MSLLVTEEMAVGEETFSGLTPELMARYADRVWARQPEGVDYNTDPRSTPVADRLVIVDGTAGDGSWARVGWIARGK